MEFPILVDDIQNNTQKVLNKRKAAEKAIKTKHYKKTQPFKIYHELVCGTISNNLQKIHYI